ncbi:response regulator [Tychonema sp. LEGE 07203]|uniref:response regulator n=1 Tax=Tychonema sp. LEGE 07203 TaxID=1828671 RepID=UPI001881E3CB|nr:response regulator [Tychonema sp. LEGE 07203]MBE9093461.1 response regulator [Tychonema sp. LEGE 07203]
MSKPVILCVDDEVVVLNSLKIQLKKEFGDAYLYEVAENADEALEIIEELKQEDESEILVIVSDWLMPGIKGDEFLILVHQKYPQIVKVMLTGQADEMAIKRVKEQANLHRCLYKPWDGNELVETIKSGLGKV